MQSRVVSFLVLASLLVGYSDRPAQVRADPKACPQYECKTVHALWKGEKGQAWGIHVKNKTDDDTDGRQNLFTPSSTEKNPLNIGSDSLDYWPYSACTPLCGKDAKGVWQAHQEVELQAKYKGNTATNMLRATCTSNSGQDGPKIDPPQNANTAGNDPPLPPEPKKE